MDKEIILENTGPKYSEMLIQLFNEFDNQLPEKLAYEEVFDIIIDAWNLANYKSFLEDKTLYKQELKDREYSNVIDKMVDFKIKHFAKYNNNIVDYTLADDVLRVKTQTQEDYFNHILKQMVNVKIKKEKKKQR
ncbi:MAG: hypothetical protein ACK5MZ_04200 [Aestuariibaculum sp.]